MITTSARRILIYRLGSLGDMLVALPALHLIRRAFPDAERRLLTNVPVHAKAPAAAAILEGSGLVDGYLRYVAGTRSVLQLLGLWWRVARYRPEVVVYLAAARGVAAARRDLRFFRLCGVKRVVGVPLNGAMQGNYYGAEPESREAKQLLEAAALEPEAARLTRNLAALGEARLGVEANWSLHLSAAEHRRAAEVLEGVAAFAARPVAVSVGTKVQAKDWGGRKWKALLTQLAGEAPGRPLLLLGAPEEGAESARAAANWVAQGGGPVLNLCGQLTPRESAAVIQQSSLFIGHDSGPMHLAASVGTPVVAIFAARNVPAQWFPFGKQHTVVYHRVSCWGCGLETCVDERKRCIEEITVAEVMAAVRVAGGLGSVRGTSGEDHTTDLVQLAACAGQAC